MLELQTYFAKHNNANNFFFKTCDGNMPAPFIKKKCLCHPPLVSYVCIHSLEAVVINVESAHYPRRPARCHLIWA